MVTLLHDAVLAAPVGPTMATVSPGATSRSLAAHWLAVPEMSQYHCGSPRCP